MANFVNDLLTDPEWNKPVVKRARHAIHFANGSDTTAIFTGKPMHYDAGGGNYLALDTALQYDSGADEYGAPGILPRIKANGLVLIPGSAYQQQTTRVGVINVTNGNFTVLATLGSGQVDGDSIVRGTGIYEHRLTLTENGIREVLTLGQAPPAGHNSLWLVLETAILGASFPDGWLNEYTAGGFYFDLPSAHDANNRRAPVRRYARTRAGIQFVYTGIPFNWLYAAAYPVEIDPDFAGNTRDWGALGGDYAGVYANARNTCAAYDSLTSSQTLGQIFVDPEYDVYRIGLKFDTTSMGAGANIAQVNMRLTATLDATDTDYDINIVQWNWASYDPISSGNQETNYDGVLAAATDGLWRNTAGIVALTQYTSANLSTTYVNKTSPTYYGLISANDQSNTAPTGNEYLNIYNQEIATTARRPWLVITYGRSATRVRIARGLIYA